MKHEEWKLEEEEEEAEEEGEEEEEDDDDDADPVELCRLWYYCMYWWSRMYIESIV